jgi:hypothetical protein
VNQKYLWKLHTSILHGPDLSKKRKNVFKAKNKNIALLTHGGKVRDGNKRKL